MIHVCCEMCALIWLRQSGYLVDTVQRVIREPQREFRTADDEIIAKWLVDSIGYVRRTQ